jgi:hypothetical protein
MHSVGVALGFEQSLAAAVDRTPMAAGRAAAPDSPLAYAATAKEAASTSGDEMSRNRPQMTTV